MKLSSDEASGSVLKSIEEDATTIRTLRWRLHKYPELAFHEHLSADLIAGTLSGWGIPVHRGLGRTGIVGVIKNGASDRAIGLRAEMDAVPITEENTFAHASVRPGRMHACGHDGHMAMLLAAGKYLSKQRDFDGTVYLIFQPAEEGASGAREMIADGLFERFPMEAIFGLHNMPGLKAGQFAISTGPVHSSQNEFKILIRGRSAHTSTPQNAIDPIPIACQMVNGFQTIISRNKRPADVALISVTMIRSGEETDLMRPSVLPSTCELMGRVQTFGADALDMIERRMRQIAEGTCQAYDCTCEFTFTRLCPPVINHEREALSAKAVLEKLVGATNVIVFEPTMKGTDDFSYFLEVTPGCYFFIGNDESQGRPETAGPAALHYPSYDFNDELIPVGGSMWVRLVEQWLRADASPGC